MISSAEYEISMAISAKLYKIQLFTGSDKPKSIFPAHKC